LGVRGAKVKRICKQVSWPPWLANMTASRPRMSWRSMPGTGDEGEVQRWLTMSVWPSREASMRGVWWSSLRLMLALSWPSWRRRETIERWPSRQARWREVLERPRRE
jgi:hypothetical protein